MKNIFFGCSMRGGDSFVKRFELAKLPEIIEKLGHKIMSKHQSRDNFLENESNLSNSEIHDRDYEWIKNSDAGIFEISNPSLGVGGEISDMLHLEKPVLCLHKKGFEENISAYILGKEKSKFIRGQFVCRSYSNISEAEQIMADFLG